MAEAAGNKKWTDKADKDLLIAMLQSKSVNGGISITADWDKVTELMTGMGYSFTKGAMTQRWSKKIQKESGGPAASASGADDNNDETKSATKPKTPRKPRATPAANGSTAKKRGKKVDDEVDDDEEEMKSFTKKLKAEIKAEEEGGKDSGAEGFA